VFFKNTKLNYNPDTKDSNKEILLEKILYYLNLRDDLYENHIDDKNDENNSSDYAKLGIDDFRGFKAEYLFY